LVDVSPGGEFGVPDNLVAAALRAADESGKDVADVPVAAIARAAGISRSTALRRLRGSRRALDDAVRAAGVEPGGRAPVRDRAIDAGAQLVSERGVTTVTLEAVADAADCSVHSLYAVFGTRDELFGAIYERYSPFHDLMALALHPAADLEQTVAGIYRAIAVGLTRKPRVAPALLADLLGNPNGPMTAVLARYFPRAMAHLADWLTVQVTAGRIRDIPIPLLLQMLIGPLWAHLLMSQMVGQAIGTPTLDDACAQFTAGFLRATEPGSRNDAKGVKK
jgi:AcrR family transcriptional regulator